MTTNGAEMVRGGRPVWLAPLLVSLSALGGVGVGVRWHQGILALLGTSSDHVESPVSESPGSVQLWTCGMHPQVIQDHPGDCPICHMKLTPLVAAGAEGSGGAGGVVIDPAVVQNMGVRTVQAVEGTLARRVRASAVVREVESGYRDINLRVSGWVQTLYADTDGIEVERGQPLFDLYSPELSQAIEELIAAKRSASAGDAAIMAAAESRLRSLGLSEEQVVAMGAMERAPDVVPFLSPIDGHVLDKGDVFTGSAVMPGQRVLRLSQRATVWIEGRVAERDLGLLRVGQHAVARIGAPSDPVYEGEVAFIHPHIDEMTRTALVRMTVANTDRKLHRGMLATMEVSLEGGADTVIVPREAVIDTGESRLVFVSMEHGRFEPRRVEVGRAGDNGMVEVLSGVSAGENVVASGQFLLDSESRLREAVAKFLDTATRSSVAADGHASVSLAPVPDGAQPLLDAAVAAYLPLSESLGGEQKSDSPLKLDTLLAALRALQGSVSDKGQARMVTAAAAAAESMQGKSLNEQREGFKGLSAAMIVLVEAMPPSVSAGPLYVVNCPMADADWLQRTEGVANPYYAEEMKACGKVVRSVATKGAR